MARQTRERTYRELATIGFFVNTYKEKLPEDSACYRAWNELFTEIHDFIYHVYPEIYNDVRFKTQQWDHEKELEEKFLDVLRSFRFRIDDFDHFSETVSLCIYAVNRSSWYF